MIQGGNHHLKYYLCEAANALRRCDPEFKRFYALKYKEANKHNHKRALALTARKLVRLVYTLLKTNRAPIPDLIDKKECDKIERKRRVWNERTKT